MAVTHLYVLAYGDHTQESDQFFKVGIARDIEKRVAQLQTGNPAQLEVAWSVEIPSRPLAINIEREVHRALAQFHVSGEWFKCTYKQMVMGLPCGVNIFRNQLGLNNEKEVLAFLGYPGAA